MENWQECATFQVTSRRLANHIRTIIKKRCFFDLEILEIHQKTNNEQNNKTLSDGASTNKQEPSNRNESQISENRNLTTPNNTEQTPTHKRKINIENLKIILNEQKTTLPSQSNIEWRTIKMETEKNKSSSNIYTNKKYNRIKWNNLRGSKTSFCENRSSLEEHKQKLKT